MSEAAVRLVLLLSNSPSPLRLHGSTGTLQVQSVYDNLCTDRGGFVRDLCFAGARLDAGFTASSLDPVLLRRT